MQGSRFVDQECDNAVVILQFEDGERSPGHLWQLLRAVGGDANDMIVVGEEERLADDFAPDFQFGNRRCLEALDQGDIAWRQMPERIGQSELPSPSQLVHEHPAPAGRDQHFATTRLPVPMPDIAPQAAVSLTILFGNFRE